MAFIEQMGVRNLIIEAKESTDWQAHQKIRKISTGLTFQDYRVIRDNVSDIVASTPRKRFVPTKTIPKPQQEPPTIYGVNPTYTTIAALHVLDGRFFGEEEEDRAAPTSPRCGRERALRLVPQSGHFRGYLSRLRLFPRRTP